MKETKNGIVYQARSWFPQFLASSRNPLASTFNQPNGCCDSKTSALIRVHPSSSAFP